MIFPGVSALAFGPLIFESRDLKSREQVHVLMLLALVSGQVSRCQSFVKSCLFLDMTSE